MVGPRSRSANTLILAAMTLLAVLDPVPALADLPGVRCSQAGGVNCSADVQDRDPAGVQSQLPIAGCVVVTDVDVGLELDHSWTGDLVLVLGSPSGVEVTLIHRPGFDGGGYGCDTGGISVVLDDDAVAPVEHACADVPPAITGTLQPNEALAAFAGRSGDGWWSLRVSDWAEDNTGHLVDWSLSLTCRTPHVDLVLDKVTDPPMASPGDTVVSTLSLSNVGLEPAHDVVVTDTHPPELLFATSDCARPVADVVVWRVGRLQEAASATCEIAFTVAGGAAGPLVNAAEAVSREPDAAPGDNAASAVTMVCLFCDDFESGDASAWARTEP